MLLRILLNAEQKVSGIRAEITSSIGIKMAKMTISDTPLETEAN
jgi:hypothetical protein